MNDSKTAYGELEGFFGGGSVSGWAVGADYTFAKNAQLQVFQTFDTKIEKTGKDRDELTRAQFVFVF